MDYRMPELSDEAILHKYIQEHLDNGETNISASFGLPVSDYGEWVRRIQKNASIGDSEWGKSLLYLCLNGEKLIGLLSIRYELPEELSEKYGDISYGVRPSERCKGYATQMLRYALSVCREKGLKQAILGCQKDDLASAATIKHNGGILFAEKDPHTKGKISQYYLIKL